MVMLKEEIVVISQENIDTFSIEIAISILN